MPRFFLLRANIDGRRGIISGAELDHLSKVSRLRPGDSITVFDDEGWEHRAVVRVLTSELGEIEIQDSYRAARESPLPITLALGLTKGDKMDFVVEKATELGVHTIVPFTSEFTVPKLDARKIAQRTERWRKIALSAAKQCGRTRVPNIEPLTPYAVLLSGAPVQGELRLLFWEKENARTLDRVHAEQKQVSAMTVVVGAEGGFSAKEVDQAVQQGILAVGLGPRILRAETAAVTVLALVQFLWGDLS
ncbi:MAG: 16S rRNA (uracil(1498)-N(3))-methyltransferase [Deltaproteobacteria bacterium]|nr:16S rRNA (uracil(1498)-N(3))-methyltransferase [Deltaproteobacteria bacterium]MBM4299842.1 16S rRNA (uracil(1498)-N(3))-methyltransferase [Deltaproteobacteria bacterium]